MIMQDDPRILMPHGWKGLARSALAKACNSVHHIKSFSCSGLLMRLTQVAVKEQETRAAQLLKEAQAEKAAADRAHAATVERTAADLQRFDALVGARQQEIARLEVRLVKMVLPAC